MGFFEEHKKQIIMVATFLLLVCALFTLGRKHNATILDNAIGFVITPLQKIATDVGDWVNKQASSLQNQTDIAAENETLKERVRQLESENKRLSLYEEENKKLSSLLKTAQKYPEYDTMGAQIIAKDPGNWYDIFMIDKGRSDGLATNMVITSYEGLVGKIIETGYGYAKAQSILDSRSSVAAISLRTGDIGVVKGEYSLMDAGLCRMEYIDAEAEIMEGDEIVTSPHSSIYPPGLSIGKVTEIKTDANGLTKYAIIEPFVDFKHLDTVLVISQLFNIPEDGRDIKVPENTDSMEAEN